MCGLLTSYFLCVDPLQAFVAEGSLRGIFAGGVDGNVFVEVVRAPTFSVCLDENSVVCVPAFVYLDSGMAGWRDGRMGAWFRGF